MLYVVFRGKTLWVNLEFSFHKISVCSTILTAASKWIFLPNNGHCLCIYVFRLNAVCRERVHGRTGWAQREREKATNQKCYVWIYFAIENLWQSKIAFVVYDKFSSWYEIKCKVWRCSLLLLPFGCTDAVCMKHWMNERQKTPLKFMHIENE